MLDMTVTQIVPTEFVKAAAAARHQLSALPERIRRRRIRDVLDLFKRKEGPLADAGVQGMEKQIKSVLLGEDE